MHLSTIGKAKRQTSASGFIERFRERTEHRPTTAEINLALTEGVIVQSVGRTRRAAAMLHTIEPCPAHKPSGVGNFRPTRQVLLC